MAFSVRLDPATEALIRRIARATGKTKSLVVREAIAEYGPKRDRQRPADLLAPFIGVGETGRADLSDDTGTRLRDIVRAKARRRRAR